MRNSPVPIHWVTLLLLLAAAIALRLNFLSLKPFWFDECFSVEVAWIDLRDFARLMWWREANMSFYYVMLRAWLHLGHSPFFIRSLSVIFAAATLPATYWLASLLYDRRVAMIATALLTFNAYHVRYSQEARSYSLFVLLATLSSGFLVAWLRDPARHYRLGYIVTGALTAYAHFYALLLLIAHVVALRWFGTPGKQQSEKSVPRELRKAWTAIGIAVLPLLTFVAKTGAGPIKWIHRPGLHDLLQFWQNLSGGNWILATIFAAACLAAITSTTALLARHQVWETWRFQFLFTWLFFPIILTAVLSFARPVFLPRYLIFCLPALLILVAAGLARMRVWWLLGPALCVTLFFSLQGTAFTYAHDYDADRDAAGAATDFLLHHTQPGDAIVFYQPATRLSYEFFRSQRSGQNTASPDFTTPLGPEIIFPNHGPGLDYRDFTGKPAADLLHAAASSHPRVWVMLMNNQPAWGGDPTTALLTQVFGEQLPRVERWQFPKVELRLYSK